MMVVMVVLVYEFQIVALALVFSIMVLKINIYELISLTRPVLSFSCCYSETRAHVAQADLELNM